MKNCTLIGGLAAAALWPMSSLAGMDAVTIKPEQVRALGLKVETAAPAAGSQARYPAQVVLPSGQQQLVTAPLPALVVDVKVSAGDAVRAGEVVLVLRSPQAQEIQRDVRTTESQAQLADATLARDEALYREGLIPQSRLQTSRAQAHQATLQRDERRRALADAGPRSADGLMQLRSPVGGVVLERLASVGQRVDSSTPLLRVGQISRLWLELQVPVRELAGIKPGDVVSVLGSSARGRVISLGHSVDTATQTVMVRAEIAAQGGLRVGQAVEAVHEQAAPGASRVPAGALMVDAGRSTLFIEQGLGRYQQLPVDVLGQQAGQAAVRGLPPGSRVVVTGVSSLKSILAAAQP